MTLYRTRRNIAIELTTIFHQNHLENKKWPSENMLNDYIVNIQNGKSWTGIYR